MDGGELRRAGGAGPGRRRQGICWSRSKPRTGGAALGGVSPGAGGRGSVGGAGPGGGRGGDGVERRGHAKSAGDKWMRRAEARAATTAAQGRARASRETTPATTAALDGVVDDGFHGGWRGMPRFVAA